MSYGGFKCIEFPFYHVQCSWLSAAQRSHKGLSRIRDLPIIATRIERSNYPERKRHRPSALCPDSRHVCKCISRSWLSLLCKCQLRWLLTPDGSGWLWSWWWLSLLALNQFTWHRPQPSARTRSCPPPEIVRSQARPAQWPGRHHTTDNCTSQFLPRVTNWPESYEKMI